MPLGWREKEMNYIQFLPGVLFVRPAEPMSERSIIPCLLVAIVVTKTVLSYRSTLRWSFDHRLHVFASTPITVLKSARILADFSRLRPPRGIGFLDINRRSNEIDPRYHGTRFQQSCVLIGYQYY